MKARRVPKCHLQLLPAVEGLAVFCTPEEANGTQGKTSYPFLAVQNPWTSSQQATILSDYPPLLISRANYAML